MQSISLTAAEIKEVFLRCVRLSQRTDFDKEIRVLNQGGSLSKRNPLAKLGPFPDEGGTLRVGGRLHHSSLPFSERHPVILSKNYHLTSLIISWVHKTALHSGATLTYSTTLGRAWIIGGRQRSRALWFTRASPVSDNEKKYRPNGWAHCLQRGSNAPDPSLKSD